MCASPSIVPLSLILQCSEAAAVVPQPEAVVVADDAVAAVGETSFVSQQQQAELRACASWLRLALMKCSRSG